MTINPTQRPPTQAAPVQTQRLSEEAQGIVDAGRSTGSDQKFAEAMVKAYEAAQQKYGADKIDEAVSAEIDKGVKAGTIKPELAEIYKKALKDSENAQQFAQILQRERDKIADLMPSQGQGTGMDQMGKLMMAFLAPIMKAFGINLKDLGLDEVLAQKPQQPPRQDPSTFVGPPAPLTPPQRERIQQQEMAAAAQAEEQRRLQAAQAGAVPPAVAGPVAVVAPPPVVVQGPTEGQELGDMLAAQAAQRRRDTLGLGNMSMEQFADLEKRQAEWEAAADTGRPRSSPVMQAQMATGVFAQGSPQPTASTTSLSLDQGALAVVPRTGLVERDLGTRDQLSAVFAPAVNPSTVALVDPKIGIVAPAFEQAANDRRFALTA